MPVFDSSYLIACPPSVSLKMRLPFLYVLVTADCVPSGDVCYVPVPVPIPPVDRAALLRKLSGVSYPGCHWYLDGDTLETNLDRERFSDAELETLVDLYDMDRVELKTLIVSMARAEVESRNVTMTRTEYSEAMNIAAAPLFYCLVNLLEHPVT
jgi:hypothetical protein